MLIFANDNPIKQSIMKKLCLFAGMALMAVMMVLATSSCSKSDDDGAGVNGGGGGAGTSIIVGKWYHTFQGSKGSGYVVLTFTQNGDGVYKEYDNGKWQGNKIFTYTFSNNKLNVNWGAGKTEVIEVASLSKAQLVLKDYPDKGKNSTFYPVTSDVQDLLDSL